MRELKTIFLIGCIILSCVVTGCVDNNNDDTGGDLNEPNTLYVDSKGTKQYISIQQAIDDALENNTIYVYAGTYYEHLVINKSIILKGENNENTIIDGNRRGDVIVIGEGGRVSMRGFTIRNSGVNIYANNDHDAGIEINSDHNAIMNNIIFNNTIGIYTIEASNNTFKQNVYDGNSVYGMYLYISSDYVLTTENTFINNNCALRIKGSDHNNVTNNIFLNNTEGLYFCCGARLNTVYHNTFINNTLWNGKDDVGNNWDNGYPIGGNYWDDYTGTDEYKGTNQNMTGSDDIGDTVYNITAPIHVDHYPLMKPN